MDVFLSGYHKTVFMRSSLSQSSSCATEKPCVDLPFHMMYIAQIQSYSMVRGGYMKRTIKIMGLLLGVMLMLSNILAGCSSPVMGNIIIYGDMASSIGCLQTNIAHQGEQVVFRARIIDPKTGLEMVYKDLEPGTAKVIIPGGYEFPMKYGGHPNTGTVTDSFWSYAWTVPLTFPTGSLGYELVAIAKDGRTGSFKTFEVLPSKLQIVPFDEKFAK
jgi:hypothetical protein